MKFKSLYGKKDDGEMGDNPYAFGLGKRAAYNFGLGKRAQSYTFGLGRKRDPYAFGLGKRADPAYAFGLGKRDPVSLPDILHMYRDFESFRGVIWLMGRQRPAGYSLAALPSNDSKTR